MLGLGGWLRRCFSAPAPDIAAMLEMLCLIGNNVATPAKRRTTKGDTMKLDDLPLFRASDPDTSQAAAQDIRLRQGTQAYKLLEQYVLHRQGLTDEEAGVFSGLASRGAGYWKRCSDLRRLGLIEDCQVRRLGVSGSMMMVCVFTPAGFEAYEQAKQ